MNHNIYVVGLGPGNIDFITGAGIKAIDQSEIVIGGKRQLEEVQCILKNQELYTLGKLDLLKAFIFENKNKKIYSHNIENKMQSLDQSGRRQNEVNSGTSVKHRKEHDM